MTPGYQGGAQGLPAAQLTLEGASVLHQMFGFEWTQWRSLDGALRHRVAAEAQEWLARQEQAGSALFSMLGHKGDLMLVHFRKSFEELKSVELELAQLEFWDFLEQTASFVSMVELGLYESSVKLYASLAARGVEPYSEEWNREVEAALLRQREAMAPRLWPAIPERKYVCFYPMDRKRGGKDNWYALPIEERRRLMHEHGMTGRRWAGEVQQIITGSVGFDDWEWGVDLFADDPLVFKKLIYEMRYDEVSARFALFGPFYVGLRVRAPQLAALLSGRL